MGFYATAQFVRDAQEHGVEVRAVDVNFSNWDCTLEARRGSRALQSTPCRRCSSDITRRMRCALAFARSTAFPRIGGKKDRACAAAASIPCAISGCAPACRPQALEKLAHADAFTSLGLNRRDALWAVSALHRSGDKDDLPLFARAAMPELEPDAHLPPMPPGQQVVEDYRHLRLSLKAHPVIPWTPWRRMSSAIRKASVTGVLGSTTCSSRSFSMTISVSTLSRSDWIPCSA